MMSALLNDRSSGVSKQAANGTIMQQSRHMDALFCVEQCQARLKLFHLAREVAVRRSELVDLVKVRIPSAGELVPLCGETVELEGRAAEGKGRGVRRRTLRRGCWVRDEHFNGER